MRVRHLISRTKFLKTQTSWSEKDLPPKHAPIYAKTKPIRAGWRWRSAKCISVDGDFTLIAECHPARGNWKAMLIIETADGASVVARFEDHSSHPGLHCHSDCDISGLEVGAKTIDVGRIPDLNCSMQSCNKLGPIGTEKHSRSKHQAFLSRRFRTGSSNFFLR